MAWSYSGKPEASNPKDQVRFLVQDTDQTDQLLSDEEITFLLDLEGGALKAATKAAETIAAKFARKCDESVGQVKVSFSQKFKQYSELAAKLKTSANIKQALPFAGGLEVTQKEILEEDQNRVQPAFTKELHDFHRTQDEKDRQ